MVEPEPIPAGVLRRAELDVVRFPIGLRRPVALSLALSGGVVGLALIVRLFRWQTSDFRLYYAAAEIGARHGWSSIYDLDLQRSAIWSITPGAEWLPFLNPPVLAWIVAPLTAVPYPVALVIWVGVGFAALTLTAFLLAGPDWLDRLALLAILLGLVPVIWALSYGQVVPIVMAVIASAYRLHRRRPAAAGLLFSLTFLKPQLTFLVPLCLLVAGDVRFFLGWAVGSVVLVGASVASLGSDGVAHYLGALAMASSLQPQLEGPHFSLYSLRWSLTTLLGPWAMPARAACLVLALTIAVRNRRDARAPIWTGAIVASLLVTPYINPPDFSLLAVAAAIWLRGTSAPLRVWFVAIAALAVELVIAVEPPIIAVEAGWLGILAVTSRRAAAPQSA